MRFASVCRSCCATQALEVGRNCRTDKGSFAGPDYVRSSRHTASTQARDGRAAESRRDRSVEDLPPCYSARSRFAFHPQTTRLLRTSRLVSTPPMGFPHHLV